LPKSTTILNVPRIDPAELVDAADVAPMIGLGNPKGVHVYRRRYDDFPEPVVDKGRCVLWRRRDIERWSLQRG
jgi:predicted DNA-binding transcriptional regulator AlpA